MPIVTVWPTPSGLPIASTTSPTRTWFESPIGTVGRPGASIFSTARSLAGSAPDDLRVEHALVGKLDAHLVGAVDDVVVGQDVAVGGRHHARSQARLARHALLPRNRNSRPKNRKTASSSGNCVGMTDAFFSTRTVTTAGATASTIGAYDVAASTP